MIIEYDIIKCCHKPTSIEPARLKELGKQPRNKVLDYILDQTQVDIYV